jgi:hypothetical protein
MEPGAYRPYRRFNADIAQRQLLELSQGCAQTDGAVAAHAEIAYVVKEDNP